jgi:exosortase
MKSARLGTRGPVILAVVLLTGALAYLYRDVFVELIRVWASDDRFSHGFLIPPIAAYLVWERRQRFSAVPARLNVWGLLVIAGSVAILLVASGGLFLRSLSLVGAVAGSVLFLCGWSRFRIIVFPLAVLLLMIPLPEPVVERIEAPLQLATSRVAEALIRFVGVPVFREGNFLALRNVTLEVAEECSGIRSLISLLTLGVVFGYVRDARGWMRVLLALLTIPVVVMWNGIRVAVTGVAAHNYGRGAAEGFVHDLCGWLAFAAAFATMFLLHRLLMLAVRAFPRGEALARNSFSIHQ